MIRLKIASGKKMKLTDLGQIQQDVIDVQARDATPFIIKIVRGSLSELDSK